MLRHSLLWGLLGLVAMVHAEESPSALPADFLYYLREFSDEQGELIDPESLALLDQQAPNSEPLVAAQSSSASTDSLPENEEPTP